MSAPHSQPHSLTPSLQPIPAEECMSESQAALWRSFLQCSGGLGPAAALPAFRTAFRMAGLALLGAEEEEERGSERVSERVSEGVEEQCWVTATHCPHDQSVVVQWHISPSISSPTATPSFTHSHDVPGVVVPVSLDCITLHEGVAGSGSGGVAGGEEGAFLASEYNRSDSTSGEAVLSLCSEVLNAPGLQLEVCYRRGGESGAVVARGRVTTRSREEEVAALLGEVYVELNAPHKQLVISFDLTRVPDFTPHSSDSFEVVDELNRHSYTLLSLPATSELAGTTYGNFGLELTNGQRFNVRYLHHNKAIAISEVVLCLGIENASNSNECVLTAEFDANTCSVALTWEFRAMSTVKTKQTQLICLYLQPDSENCENNEMLDLHTPHNGITIVTSGERSGRAVVALQGAVRNGHVYQLHYTEHAHQNWVSYGNICFGVQGVADEDQLSDRLYEAYTANAQVSMQYLVHAAEDAQSMVANPLLSVEIDNSFSLKQFAESFNAEDVERSSIDDLASNSFDPIDSALFQAELYTHIDAGKPLVIFAGAGCSMAAPACSPAWWRLLADLLSCTFDAAPHRHCPQGILHSDITRQPEEIMESFHYILGDDLLTLFRMLEEGRPNANHLAIARLAKAGKVKAIFTTNFDIFIERALHEVGVNFITVVTQREFEQYHHDTQGDTVAVLKIHGTLERPETIVAVANHYKSDKGFSSSKANVLASLVEKCPVLFVGYSGWDFLHSNYQAFWAGVGANHCLGLFWLTLRGARGGPVLGDVVGAHVGGKLRIGAGALPELLVQVLERYAPGEGDHLALWASRIDDETESARVREAQAAFMRRWVTAVHPATLLSLVMIEAERLGVAHQKHVEKIRSEHHEIEAAESTVDSQAIYMKIAMDLQSGKINHEEYGDLIAYQTLKTTFQFMVVEKSKKEQLVQMCMNTQRTHPLLKDDPTLKSLLPSLLLALSMGLPSSACAEEFMTRAVAYLTKLNNYKSSLDTRDKIMYETYMYCSTMLSGTDDQQRQIETWVEALADNCVREKLSDDVVTAKRTALSQRIYGFCNGKVDIASVLQDQISLWLLLPDQDITSILRCGLTIALALIHESDNRADIFSDLPGFASKVTAPLSSRDHVPAFVFEEFENKFNQMLTPVLARITAIRDRSPLELPDSSNCPSPDELLAAFDISSLLMWYPVCKHIGHGFQEAQQAEHKGFYPKEALPPSVCTYLIPRAQVALQKCTPDDKPRDARLVQPLLALMVKLGESVGDFELIEQATRASLELTEGRVTEVTPAPIPEALAYACQERGNYSSALYWYTLALDGIKTCIFRLKTDAIVLNACLVAAQCNCKKNALKWAFLYSPQFARGVAGLEVMVGPARPLLMQHVIAWCQELGFPSMRAARDVLTRAV